MEPAHFSEITNLELTDKNTPTSSHELIVAGLSSVECQSATAECLPAVKNCPPETDECRTVTDVCQKAASKRDTAIECYRAANECQAAANAILTNQNTDEMNAMNWVKDTDPIDDPSSSCKPTQVKYSLSEMSPSSSLHHPSPRDSGVDVSSPSHRSDEEITASSVGQSTPCTVEVDAVLAPKLASEQFKEANASNTKLHMSDDSLQGLKTIRRARCFKRTSCCDCCHVQSTNQNVKRKRNSFTAIAPAVDKLSMERCSVTQQNHVTHDTGTLKTILKRSATLPSSKKPPRKSTHFNKELKYSSDRSGSNLMRCKNDVAVTTQTEIIAETLRSDFLSINNCNRYVKSSENDALDLDLQCKVQAEKSNDVGSQILRPELSCESVRPTFRFFSGDRRRSNDSDIVKQNMLRKFAGCGGSPEKKCQNSIGESGVCRKSNAPPSLNSVSTKPTKKEYSLTSVIEPNPTKLVIRISTAAKPSSIDRVSSESVVLEKISLPIANKRKSPNICVRNTKVTNVRDPHFASSSQKNSVLFNSNLRSNAGEADQLSRIISFDRFQEPVSKDCSSSLVPKRTSKIERRRISKKSSLKPRPQLINSNLTSRPKDEDPSNIRDEQTDTKLKEICSAAENSFSLNVNYGIRTDIMNNRKPIFSCLPAEHGILRQSKVNDHSAEIDICTDVLTKALSKGIVEPPIITEVPVDQSKQGIEASVEKISLSIKRVGSNGTWYVPSKHNESKRKKSKKKKHHTPSSPPLVDVVPEVIRNAFSPAFSLPVVSQPDTPATSPIKKSPTLSQIMCISKIKASIAEFKSKIRITTKKCNDDGSSKSDQSPQKTVAATESIVDSTGENETIPGATTDLDSGIITASSIESNDCLINEEKLCDKDNPSVTNDTTSGIEVIVKTETEPFVEISRTDIMLSECKKEKELMCIVKNDDKKDLALGNETSDWFSDPREVVKTVVSSPSVLASPSKMKNYSRTQGFCLSEEKYKVGVKDALLLQSMVSLPVDSRYVKQELIDDDQYDNVLHRPQIDSVSHRPPINSVPHGPPISSILHGLQIDSFSQKPQMDSVLERPQVDSVLLESPINSVSHGPLIDNLPSIVGVHGPSNDGVQHGLQNDTVCQALRIEENCNSIASRGLLCVKKEISGFSTSEVNILPKSNETLCNEFPNCSATSDPIVPLSRIGKLKKPNMDQLRLSFTTSDFFDKSKLSPSDLDVSKLLHHTFSKDLHLDVRENICISELALTEDSHLVTSEKNGINSLNSATETCCITDPNRATDIGAKTKTTSTAKSVSSNPFVCFDQSLHEDVINCTDTITKLKPMPVPLDELKPILVQNENEPKLLLVQTYKIKSLINNVGAVKTSLQTLEHGFESLLLPADQLNPLVRHADERKPVILLENEPTPLEAREIKQQTSLRESAKGVSSHAHSVAENNHLPISIVLLEETKLSMKTELFSIQTPFKDSVYSELQKVEQDGMGIQSDGHALSVRLTEEPTPYVNVTDGQSFSSTPSRFESALKMHASECALSRGKDNEFESCVGQETSATSTVVINDKNISVVRLPIESIPPALQSSNVLPGNVAAQTTGIQSNEPTLSARKLTEVSHLISQSEVIGQPEAQGNNAVLSISPKEESVQPLELRSVLPTGDLVHADMKCKAEPYECRTLLQSATVENTPELTKLITDVKTTELINLLPNVNTAKLTDANVRRELMEVDSDGLSIDTSDVSSSVESIFPLLKEAICKALEEFDAPFEPLLIEPESGCITESLTEASFLESASLNFPSLPEETLALHDSCAELDLSLLNDAFGPSHCSSESLLFSETDAVNSISTLSESLAVSEPSFEHTSLHTSLPQKSSSISDLNLLTDSLSLPESSLFLPSNCLQPGVTNTSSPQLGNFPDSLPLNESGVSTELISQAETWPFLDSSLPLESLALLEYFSLNPNCLSSFPEPSAFPEQSLVDALSLLESGCPVSDAVALSEFGPISECMSLAESWSLLESCLSQESLSLPELLSMNDSLSYPHFISPSFKLQSGGSLFSHISKPLTRSMSAPVPLCSLNNESLPLKPTSSTSVFSNSSVKLLFSQPSRSSASVLTNPLCKLLPTQSASSTSVFPNSTSKLLPPMSSFSSSMLPNSTCASEGAITRSHGKAKLDLRVDIPFVSDINKRTRSKTLNTSNSNDSSDQNLSNRLRSKKTGSSCEQLKRTCKNPPLSNPQLSASVQPVTELETTAPVLIKVRARKPRKSKKSSAICIPTLTAEITASLHAEENNLCVTENEPKISATLGEKSHVESCGTNNVLSVTSDDLCSLGNSPVNEAAVLKVCSKKKSEKRKRSENDHGRSNVKKLKMNQNNLSKSVSPTACETVLVLKSVATITNKSRKRKISGKCPALSNIKQEMLGEEYCCDTSLIHPTEDVLTKLTEHVKSIAPLKDQITLTSQLVADKNASTGLESVCRENPEPVLKISKRKLKPRTNAHTPLAMNTAYEKPCVTLSSLPASNIGNTVDAIETSKFTALIQNTYLSTSNNHGCVSSIDPIARDSCIVSSIPALPNPSDAISSKRKPLVISNFWDKSSRQISKCRKTALQGNGDKSLASDTKREKSKHSRSRTLSCSLDNKTTTLNIHKEGLGSYHFEDLHRDLPLTNVIDIKQPINIPRSELKDDVLSESSFDAKLSICELPRNMKNPSVGLCVQSSIKQEYNDCPTLNREQHTKLEQQQCYPDTTNLPFLESASDLKPFSDYAKKNYSSHTKRRRNSLSDSIKVTISETSPIQRRQKTNGAENVTQVSCTLSMQSNCQPSKRLETGTMLSSNDEITNNLTSTINLSNGELNQSDKVIKETNQSIEKKKVKTKRKRFNSIVTVVNAVDDQLSVQKDDLVSYESIEESAKDKNICAVSNCDQIASPSTISSTIVSRCGKAITEKKPTFSGGYLSAFAKFLQRSETLGVVSRTLLASYKDISTTDCSSDALKKKADDSGVACLNDASVDNKDLNNKNVAAFPQEHVSFTPTNSLNINESLLASSSSAATARKNFRQQSRIFRRSTLVKRMNKSPPRRDTDETSRESRDNEYPGAVQQISNVLPGQLQNIDLSHPCSSTSVTSSQSLVCEENTISFNGSNRVVSDKRFIAKESEDVSRIIKRRKSCNRGIMMKAIEGKVAAEPNEPSRDLSNVIKQEVACVDRIDDTPDCDADEIGLPYIRIEIDSNEGSVSIFSSGRDGLQNDRLPIKTVIDEGSRSNSLENTNEIYDDINHPSITTLEDQAIILAVPAKGLTQHSRCNEKPKISNDEIIVSKRASCQTSDLEISRSKSATNKECIEEVNVLESLSGGECGASINVGNNGNDVIYDKRTSRNIVENKKILTGVISQKLTNISRKVNARRQSNEPVPFALFAENIRIRGKRNKLKNQAETSRDKIAFRIRAHSASEGSQSNVKSETCRLNADQLEFSQYMMERVDRFRKRNIVSNENVNQIFTSHQHKSHVTYVRYNKQINSSASEFVDVSFTSLQLKLATLETNVQILLDALFRDIVGERKCHDLPQITALSNRLLPKAEQTIDFVHTLLTNKSSTKHDYKFKVPTPLHVQCSAKSLYKSIATPHSDKASASACVVLLCNHPRKCLVRLKSKITALLKLALPNITVNVEDLCKDKSVDDLLQLITCANSETTTSSEIMPCQA